MPDTTKISFAEWRKYEYTLICEAWHQMGKAEVFWSVGGAMLVAILEFREGLKPYHDTLLSIANIVGVTVLIFLLQFLIKLFAAPAKLAKEADAKIKSLDKTTDSLIEIKGIPIEISKHSISGTICQILIHNKSQDTPAKNVKVTLLEMEDSPENKSGLSQELPFILKQEPNDEKIINAGDELKFTLFDVTNSNPTKVVAGFERGAKRDKRYRLFDVNTDYLVKIKATADPFSPTETEFILRFTSNASDCRFTLTKTDLYAELSKLLGELNARRHSIEFMPRAAYETEYSNNGGDIKSQELLQKIFNFILSHFGETEHLLFKSDAGFPLIRLSSKHPNRENAIFCLREYGKKIEELISEK